VISQSLRASATRRVAATQAVRATPVKQQPQRSPKGEIDELKRQFPKVDYDAAEPSDPNERKKRKEKGKRFDKLGGVSSEPTRYSSGLRNHWEINLPALPIAQSNAVVVARTLSRTAYLSNDKGAVFTELCINIDEVLKSTDNSLQKDSRIDVNRLGGVVRYRTGEESLLFVNGQNMPAEGKRYLFFLKAIPNSHDFTIITGYELGTSSVTPLDTPPQFAQFEGVDVSVFLDTVRRALLEQKN
jgi:hypothetical protein